MNGWGDLGSGWTDIASSAFGISDPRDREAVALAEEIVQAEIAGSSTSAPGEPFKLRRLTPYLKVYRFHQQNPWAIPAALGAVAIAAVIGFVALGSRRS